MISARVYNHLGELILVSVPDWATTERLDRLYPDWATILVTREVRIGPGCDVDAIWENLVSITHRDGSKRTYGA